MDSLLEILKNGDESITDIYEGILLGKIRESSPPAEFISGEAFKKALASSIDAL